MTKSSLYVNSKGYEVSRHSYSGSADFQFCPRKDDAGDPYPYESVRVEQPFNPDNAEGLWDSGDVVWVGIGETLSKSEAALWILRDFASIEQIKESKRELIRRLQNKEFHIIRRYEEDISILRIKISAKQKEENL